MAASPFHRVHAERERAEAVGRSRSGVAHCEKQTFSSRFIRRRASAACHRRNETPMERSASNRRKPTSLVGLCGGRDGKLLGTSMPKGVSTLTFWDLYYKYGHEGDSAPNICRTEILKQFPFDVRPGEKFIAKPYVYHQIDQHYCLRVVDKKILIARENIPTATRTTLVTKENRIGYKSSSSCTSDIPIRLSSSQLNPLSGRMHFGRTQSAASPPSFVTALAWLPASSSKPSIDRDSDATNGLRPGKANRTRYSSSCDSFLPQVRRYQLNYGTLLGEELHSLGRRHGYSHAARSYERFFVKYPSDSWGNSSCFPSAIKVQIVPFKVVDPRTVVFEKIRKAHTTKRCLGRYLPA